MYTTLYSLVIQRRYQLKLGNSNQTTLRIVRNVSLAYRWNSHRRIFKSIPYLASVTRSTPITRAFPAVKLEYWNNHTTSCPVSRSLVMSIAVTPTAPSPAGDTTQVELRKLSEEARSKSTVWIKAQWAPLAESTEKLECNTSIELVSLKLIAKKRTAAAAGPEDAECSRRHWASSSSTRELPLNVAFWT